MAFTKKITKETLILFLFLAFLPFGQILRIPVAFLDTKIYLNASDALALISLFLVVISKIKYPRFWKAATDFLIVVGFSLPVSLSFFPPTSIILGAFYLLRLISYFYLFAILWNFLKKHAGFKDTVFKGLILSSAFIAVFGWLQYLRYPDLRSLLYFNWDEHLLRMVGGFLDPTFTGIFLVFGVVLSTLRFLKEKKKDMLLFTLFLLVSLAFTYSRASYLALGVSLVAISLFQKKFKEIVLLGAIFILIIFLLPKGVGEGVKLGRVSSIYAKTQNYQESLKLAKISPIFGIGYNNVCLAKGTYLGQTDEGSHSCSGLDASLLFLLVTSGVTGVFSFANLISILAKNLKKDIYGKAFVLCGVALLVHSLFANSLFYSWVMGFMAILLALAI